jgi:hypothetical protein
MDTEELVKYAFPVTIRVSYRCETPGTCPPRLWLLYGNGIGRSWMLRDRRARAACKAYSSCATGHRHGGRGERAASSAVALEAEERAVVELHGVACMLMRESEFFMGALSNGFRETATKVINYHADSQQGKSSVALGALLES